jgi:hypothetical protein
MSSFSEELHGGTAHAEKQDGKEKSALDFAIAIPVDSAHLIGRRLTGRPKAPGIINSER